jgi:primosomal protein N'
MSETPLGLQRTECWRCGYQRLIYESCPECGGSCKPVTKAKQQETDTDD